MNKDNAIKVNNTAPKSKTSKKEKRKSRSLDVQKSRMVW